MNINKLVPLLLALEAGCASTEKPAPPMGSGKVMP